MASRCRDHHDCWRRSRWSADESRKPPRLSPRRQSSPRGEIFRNPDIARALTLIADQGESAFYKGEIAKAILKTSDTRRDDDRR